MSVHFEINQKYMVVLVDRKSEDLLEYHKLFQGVHQHKLHMYTRNRNYRERCMYNKIDPLCQAQL